MNEWLAPLIGFLVFLFFCPGVFVWIYYTNRQVATVEQKEPRAERPLNRERGTRILKPVTALFVLGLLTIVFGFNCSGDNTVLTGRPKGRTSRSLPAKTAHGNTGKRIESVAAEFHGNLPAETAANRAGVHASPSRTEYLP